MISTATATTATARFKGRARVGLEPRHYIECLADDGVETCYLLALPLELHELCLAIHLVLYMDLKANTL